MGIARILYGILARRNVSKWSKAFAIGVGILSIDVSIMIFASPLVGAFLVTLLLAINLLILGSKVLHMCFWSKTRRCS